MTADYTPGHALDAIVRVISAADLDGEATPTAYIRECLTRLYKAGQANERAAIVAALRGYAELRHIGVLSHAADLFERGEL